jgi:ADP-ribosylglycohydrolase
MSAWEDRVLGGLFGVCIGDALGVPVEGMSREYLNARPVRGYGYGGTSRRVPEGWWSDDSSLTLCLAESLVRITEAGRSGRTDETGGAELTEKDMNLIGRTFCRWLFKGHWTPGGRAFGIGYTTAEALERIRNGVPADSAGGKGEWSNGNGSLMRILPVVFYLHGRGGEHLEIVHRISSITHAHPRSQLACGIYVLFALLLLEGQEPAAAYKLVREKIPAAYDRAPHRGELEHFERIIGTDISRLKRERIRSSGYVVHTLEAALWCFLTGASYEDTVLRAVNLGNDSDTTGAVAGGIAGLFHGFSEIPVDWVERTARYADIVSLGKKLARISAERS